MVRKRVKFLYLFEGVLILMTISMILLLAGCTKEDSGMDGPASVVKGEKIQQETVDREKATHQKKRKLRQMKRRITDIGKSLISLRRVLQRSARRRWRGILMYSLPTQRTPLLWMM